jgi:hypothetical protein
VLLAYGALAMQNLRLEGFESLGALNVSAGALVAGSLVELR